MSSHLRRDMLALAAQGAFDSSLSSTWELLRRPGPVLATAIHSGHIIRKELEPFLAADDAERRREEDPLTGFWAGVGDSVFRTHTSRFEVDLNRHRDRAFSDNPEDTWGLRVWRERPPEEAIESSLNHHDCFYSMMVRWIERLVALHGTALVLDLHSYNHRRDGKSAAPAGSNPDIDLGVTTLDPAKFGSVVDRLEQELLAPSHRGRRFDVRRNIRYPDGGYFPEWVFSKYGDAVCTITLEFKKFYMDEWTGEASLDKTDDVLRLVHRAKQAASVELLTCRR